MEKDTIIFDLDGTLLNTLDNLHACFNHAIKSFGYQERTLTEIKNFVGNGIKKAIARALPENIEDEMLDKIVDYFRFYYEEHLHELTQPYEGILELLRELNEKGYKLAVVSNKYDDAVKELCEYYFGKFIKVAVGEGYGVRRKPETDGVLKAITELDSSIEKAIFVGDSDVDIATAKNAKIPCISVLWGYRDEEFLKSKGAFIFAKEAKDIIKIIEKKLYLR